MKALLALLLLPALAFAGSIKLQWDANKEPDLAGYKVYKSRTGRKPFTYAATVPASATQVTLNHISSNLPHVFAVTAFNNMSAESGYSNRVKVSVPMSKSTAGKMGGGVSSGF